MSQSETGREDELRAPASEDDSRAHRSSSVFERPAGNVFVVPDDGGPALDDVSERPTLIAAVEVTEPTES